MDGHGISSEKLLRSLPRMVFTDFVSSCTYFQLTPWWSTNNAALVGEDGETPTVNSEGIVEAVDFLNGMYKDGICPEPISSDGYPCLQQSGCYGWCWSLGIKYLAGCRINK